MCVRVCVCVCVCVWVCECDVWSCNVFACMLVVVCEGEEWAWVVVHVGCVGVSLFCVFALQGPVLT